MSLEIEPYADHRPDLWELARAQAAYREALEFAVGPNGRLTYLAMREYMKRQAAINRYIDMRVWFGK